jgi:hypothetical protein
MASMKKISWDEAFKNTTFFFVDSSIEAFYENELTKRVSDITQKIAPLSKPNGVLNFIKNEEDSLSTLITLLGISGERLKRIVSMIRADYGHVFETEWDHAAMRGKLLQNPQILEDVCELFSCGYVSPKFASRIPHLILQKFRIDDTTLKRVNNTDFLRELVQKKLDVEYYTKYKEAYDEMVYNKLQPIADKYGLEIMRDTTPDGCTHQASHILKSGAKSIIINESYNLTTGQGQSVYQRNLAQMYGTLRDNPNTLLVNMLDGAGWIARGSDYRQIYYNCNYFFNLKTLDKIEDLVIDFFNVK